VKPEARVDRTAEMNRVHWEASVRKGVGSTRPSLDLSRELVEQYALGELEPIPDGLERVLPHTLLRDVAEKDVLCLGAGGGQQSPIFGLMGAHVTVFDLTEGQLAGDREGATHYGYSVRTVQGDMRDLSCFEPESFDLVYQTCTCWIPDVREVYREVVRVLRSGGLYRVCSANPLGEFSDHPDAKDGGIPYSVKEKVYQMEGMPECIQYRHHLSDVFNGLIEVGLVLEEVVDPGGWFIVLASRPVGGPD